MKVERISAVESTIRSSDFGRLRRSAIAAAMFVGSVISVSGAFAAEPGMDELKKVMQGQLEMMKPELRTKVEGLSTDTKMSLMAILAMHSRNSERATMRQVMTEVLSDFQSIPGGHHDRQPGTDRGQRASSREPPDSCRRSAALPGAGEYQRRTAFNRLPASTTASRGMPETRGRRGQW